MSAALRSSSPAIGGQMGDKKSQKCERGWTITAQPLEFMVLPMRFERMAYRLGGDFNAFT